MSGEQYTPLDTPPAPDAPAGAASDPQARDLKQTALEEIIRPLAITSMLTCIAIALSQMISSFSSEWPGGFFTALTFIVCLESIHSERFLARTRLSGRDRFRFRFVEWVSILLLVRFGVYLRYGMRQLMADMAAWTTNLGSFFEIGFVLNALLIWYLASLLSRTMRELEASPIERMPAVTDPDYYLRSTMPRHGRTDRRAGLNRIVSVFFWGGAALLVLTGISQVDVQDLIVFRHSRSSGIILNALAYFLIGFLIISQAHYTILKANWDLQGIPILGPLGRRWVLLLLAFLAVIGLVSALLPVSYSVGILDVLFTVVRWTVYMLAQFAFLLLFIISYVLGFLIRLLTGRPTEGVSPEMQRITPPPAPPTVAQEPALWWQVLRSLLFWAVLTGVVGYSLFHFLGDRWDLFRKLSATRLFAWLRGLWGNLGRRGRGVMSRLRAEIARRLAARQQRVQASTWRYFSLRRLTPRERLRYFYLSILYRSAKQGFGRAPSLTPLEYEDILRREMPEAEGEVHALTQSFIEARYTEHSISREYITPIEAAWRYVKRVLNLHRRRPAAKESSPAVSDE